MKRLLLARSMVTLPAMALLIAGCASSVKKYDYPPTTNATDEIQRVEEEMTTAERRQVAVLSPNHFAAAREKLADAKKTSQKGKSNADVLDDLGYARTHLEMATTSAAKSEELMPAVVSARSDAITAEAPRLRSDKLKEADNDLKKVTSDVEDGKFDISVEKKGELQKEYLAVELASVKAQYLDESKALIEAAKKNKASKLAKDTLAATEAKYQATEKTIETDRHDTGKITRASDELRADAKRLVKVTELSKNTKNGTSEAAAIQLDATQRTAEAERGKAESERDQKNQKTAQLNSAQGEIRDQQVALGAADAENANLSKKMTKDQRFNQSFKTAQESFSSDEAEVFRDGDKLLIRLKGMEFPTGKADLPSKSLPVLAKVKQVMDSMAAEKVMVEGHTDSVGSKASNEKLSESRAKAIAKYLVSVDAVTEDHVETKGYGFNKPIATNKTKEGRAQNRRVDLIISPMTE